MKLTPQQQAAVDFEGHAVITACPGSGKTRTIIAKVLRCIDKLIGTPRKVACITYTNTAVHEIENRIKLSGGSLDDECYEVSTIHAFCQANILSKYHWMTGAYNAPYKVLPSDHEIYVEIVKEIGDQFGLSEYQRSQFEQLGRMADGAPSSNSIPPAAALAFWEEFQLSLIHI